jgi:hypothetical protein
MDLRVHTPTSIGLKGVEGILDVAPALVRLAKVKGIDVLGISDYYNGDFLDRVQQAAQNTKITVIPGLDLLVSVGNCDDVEISCLFPENFGSEDVRTVLNSLGVKCVDSDDSIFRVDLNITKIIERIEQVGGVLIPSRMDRTPGRRGVIPILVEEFGFRTFDLALIESAAYFEQNWPQYSFNLFSFSNANALAQVGSRITRVSLPHPTFAELKSVVMRQLLA